MQATDSEPTQRRIVREYASSGAFHKDARELYARAGYTVADTAGITHRGLAGFFLSLWPREEHLVITYQAPTIPRLATAGARGTRGPRVHPA
jgi:hypothetical protein